MARTSALINVMSKAARKAARGLVHDFGEVEQLQVSKKGPADFVSVADHKAERSIVSSLSDARPGYSFLVEEAGEIAGDDAENRWIVDPLDGTLNFLHGIPHFAISIALERQKEIVAGIVYNPITDDLYWAEKGLGAYVNHQRLRVSSRADLQTSVIATGLPFPGRGGQAEYIRDLQEIMGQVAGIRRFGAAALDLAYVAAGRFDGFWEYGLKPWDVAAGMILIRESGGLVTDVPGKTNPLTAPSILATNATLHRSLQNLLNSKA